MGEKEISVDFSELGRVEIYCPHENCKVGLILEMPMIGAIPSSCPACQKEFSDHARTALAAYQRFFQNALDSGMKIKFRVKVS